MSNHEFETEIEQHFASLEAALTSPDSSRHLDTCAKALRELQSLSMTTVIDVQAEAEHLMADAPFEDFQRVMVPLFRLFNEMGRWNNYVGRLIDNGFNFAETPYRKTSEAPLRTQPDASMPFDIVVRPPGPTHYGHPH